MSKLLNFAKRNVKEILRDPIIYIFCLGFPLVMLILFTVIGKYSGGNTPMFDLKSLLPGIIMFSYTFVMIVMALLVSKDRQTSFLKRLYSSPMKAYHFILGYAIVGFVIGVFQTIICIVSAFIMSLCVSVEFVSFLNLLLLIVSQLPILITFVFLGILFGTIFNDKTAPGICSILISLAGILGGCWMPLDAMGDFEVFCRCLPFYPSVYLGRIVCGAITTFGKVYTFNSVAALGFIPLFGCMVASVVLSCVVFKNKMVGDK